MSKPDYKTVKEYMQGQDEIFIRRFYEKYSTQNWVIGSRQIIDWKCLADEYIKRLSVNKQMGKL
jgi:hypothetical protein